MKDVFRPITALGGSGDVEVESSYVQCVAYLAQRALGS